MIDYSKVLSRKATALKPSGIRKFFDILDEMDDVVSLTVGQPDFVTPWHIRDAAIDSLEKGKTYYTSNSGLLSFREAIAAYLERRFNVSIHIADSSLAACRLYISLVNNETIDEVMAALKRTLDVKVQRDGHNIVIEP